MSQQIILLLTGLVFLLFGMIKLGNETQRILGVRIRQFIKYLSKKAIYGIGLGAASTAVFQSSATIVVMAIGMVSAGLISFTNSLGIVLGAGIGTTITAQLVAFKITAIAPIFIIIGVFLWFTGKEKLRSWGEVIFYFGLLFFGLTLINQAIIPWKTNPAFLGLFQNIKNPLLGVLVGFIITIILQSSSATTSILVILAMQGLVTIESGLPLILGANVGTAVTPFLLSLGGGINARRTGLSHLLFKVITAIIVFPFLLPYASFLKFFTSNTAQQIASGHLFFSILMVCIFIFFLKPFAKLLRFLIPGKEKILPLWPEYLDKRYLSQPSLALGAVRKELTRGALLTEEMFLKALKITFKFNDSIFRNINFVEMVINSLQKDVMRFLEKVPKNKMNRNETAKLIQYSAMIDTIERLADHAVNLSKLAKYKGRGQVDFSRAAWGEIEKTKELVAKNVRDTISLIETGDKQKIQNILRREEQIDELVDKAKEKHLERFYRRECAAADGPIFNDVIINLERMSDHCVNITEYYKR